MVKTVGVYQAVRQLKHEAVYKYYVEVCRRFRHHVKWTVLKIVDTQVEANLFARKVARKMHTKCFEWNASQKADLPDESII